MKCGLDLESFQVEKILAGKSIEKFPAVGNRESRIGEPDFIGSGMVKCIIQLTFKVG